MTKPPARPAPGGAFRPRRHRRPQSRQAADDLVGVGDDPGGKLAWCLAENENLPLIPAAGEQDAEPLDQGQGGDEDGDGHADAQGGHQRGGLALQEIAILYMTGTMR